MATNNNNLSLKDERQLAKDYNYNASVNPINTAPTTPTYVPGMSTTRDIPLPDYESRERASKIEMPNIVNNIRQLSRGSFSAEMANPNPFAEMLAGRPQPALTPYGERVSLAESHEMNREGEWVAKYPKYYPGINNEDYYARRQGTWDKVWNGVGKLAFKSALYGASGIIMIPDKLMAIAKEGSLKAALNTNFDKFADDLDKSIDRLFPHYYRKESEDYNLWQKMTRDTGNFIWNDVVGSGMSFTFGAMLTAAATGGLGAASLGSTGAKLGLRAGAKIAARDAARKGVGSLKGVFNNYLRTGVQAGRTIGGIAQNISFLSTSAAFEAGFESRSYAKESEQQFKDYYNRMYGRDPNFEELSAFRETNNTIAGGVFAANMGIVGLSNWLLFGKYFGVGGKAIGKGEKWLNKKLFGLGTEVKAPGEIALKVTEPNKLQKVAGTVFNITKRPFSEGVWEEGTQGVVQNAAEEYVKSRYDSTVAKRNVGVFDAIWDGFKKQYTTKEGWNEIGIGAIIGGLFGAREGTFGIMEYRNRRIQLENQVKNYNSKISNLNNAAVNLLKQSISLGPQISQDVQSMTSKQFDEATFAKMSVDNEMGLLDDSSENFRTMMKSVPLEEIAQEQNISVEEAETYVNDLIEDYDRSLDNFKKSIKFADNLIGDENRSVFKDYVARNAFMGLQSSEYLDHLANKISTLASTDTYISSALKIYSKLSADARAQAKELFNLKNDISEIERKLEDVATRPNRVDENGVDTAAEEIRNKTAELKRKREEYDDLLDRLSSMTSKEFDVNSFLNATEGIQTSALDLAPVSSESIVEATEQLRAFDNFVGEGFNAKNIALRNLLEEYKDRLVDYRNMNNLLSKMLDKRFMRQEERGFMKLLSDVFTKEYKGEGETPDIIEPRALSNLYQSDKAIDEALAAKQISEDEAFSFKALMHSFDSVRREKRDEESNVVEESVSDEAYENTINTGNIDPIVEESVLSKLYTQNQHLLTPREAEIYDLHKGYFDDRVSNMGDSPVASLLNLRNKVESLLSPTSTLNKNKAIIDLAREKLNDDQKKEFDDAIDTYNRLSNDQDEGKDVDETELLQAMYSITDLGQAGNIIDLIPFVEQNRILERGTTQSVTTIPDFGSTDDQLAALSNETDDAGTKAANIDSAQNPSVLLARRIIGKSGEELYEVSGLRPDRFIEEMLSNAERVEESTLPNGFKKYEVTFKTEGVESTAIIFETPTHNRFVMSNESVSSINQNSDFIIKDVSGANGYFAILRKNADGTVVPFKSGIGFGVNETDKIDEKSLSEIKVGDEVELVVDVKDTYNQSLINSYLEAVNENDKEALDKAKSDLANNMVIKVMKDGKFVSVIRADYGDGTPGLSSLRSKAFDAFTQNNNASIISLGSVKVAQSLPGKPNYSLNVNEDGSVDIVGNDITEEGAKKIVNVGYILNGKISLKEKGKYSMFPFGTNIVREADEKYKDIKVPVVVIKGSNGVNYVYPVGLKSNIEEGANPYLNTINELTGPDGMDLIPYSLSDIQGINAYITRLGLSPIEYQIPLTGTMIEIQNALKKAAAAIEREANKPNVDDWVIDDSRSVSDIAMNDVNININLENDMFIAPKIRLSLPGISSSSVVIEDEVGEESMEEVEEEELPFPTRKEEVPSRAVQPSDQPNPISAGAVEESKRTTSKKFSTRIEELPKEYKGFFDFLGRKIASGDLKFLRVRTKDKRTGEDIRRFLGLPLNTDIIKRVSSSKGMPISKYIDWLRSLNEDIVKDYMSTRTDEQIMMELKTFLNAIEYKPGNALNYSRRINGMDVLSEYNSEEDVKKIESAINNEVTTSLELKSDIETVVDKTTEAILNIPNVGSFEEIKESFNESGNLTNEEIVSVVDQIIEEYSESLPEGEQNVFSEQFIEKWEKIRNEGRAAKTIEEGGQGQSIESSVTESTPAGEGQPREVGAAPTDGGLPRYEGVIKEEQVGITDELSVENVPRATITQFLFAGDDAYTNLPGTSTEIPANIIKRNGIKKGVSLADLAKLGYKRAGGSWIYKFYMNTGLYDMYNIHTGEAFRFSPNEGVKVNSSSFLQGLKQKGRNISNLIGLLSNEEIQRNNLLVNKTNSSSSEKEINNPC